ncbi:phage holin family protein [Neisseria sp.]|uniref:phage holin family protein n=1 Tax=Neisseria sp. TaxID=192066 RepID=UPI0035A0CFE5
MSLNDQLRHYKTLAAQSAELLRLRVRILGIDAAEQAGNAVRIIMAAAVSLVLMFTGLISVLFLLNRLLDDTAAVYVFAGMAAVCLLLIVLMLWRLAVGWKKQNQAIAATLRDIRGDIELLRSAAGNGRKKREQEK